jgi:hypothetical protein
VTQPHQSEDSTMKPVACDYEPEPEWDRGPLTVPAELTDDATWVAFDLARNVDKGPRLAQRDTAAAVEAQLVDFRAKGLL